MSGQFKKIVVIAVVKMQLSLLLTLLGSFIKDSTLQAGSVERVSTAECDVRFRGAIEQGDAQRIQAIIESIPDGQLVSISDLGSNKPVRPIPAGRVRSYFEVANNFHFARLCLASEGGDYNEAIKIIEALMSFNGVATIVEANTECLSACALVFLSGHRRSSGTLIAPYRRLHIRGKLGFHAPFLPTEGATENQKLIQRSYAAGVQAVAKILGFRTELFPKGLLVEMLKRAPGEFFVVDSVWQAGAWKIGLFGYRLPNPKSESDLFIACKDDEEWESLGRSDNGEQPDEDLVRKQVNLQPGFRRWTFGSVGFEATQNCIVDVQSMGSSGFMIAVRYVYPDDPQPPNSFRQVLQVRNFSELDLDDITPRWQLYPAKASFGTIETTK